MKYCSIEEQILYDGYISQESGIYQTSLFMAKSDPDVVYIRRKKEEAEREQRKAAIVHEVFKMIDEDPVAKAIYDKWLNKEYDKGSGKRIETLCRAIKAAQVANLI